MCRCWALGDWKDVYLTSEPPVPGHLLPHAGPHVPGHLLPPPGSPLSWATFALTQVSPTWAISYQTGYPCPRLPP